MDKNKIREIIKEELQNEYFGGSEGKVDINISGEGRVKDVTIQQIKATLKLMGGNINLYVDGIHIPIHSYGGGMG